VPASGVADVTRYEMKDKASSYSTGVMDRFRQWWMLDRRGIKHGPGCMVKRHVDIRLTDNAILELGERVIIDDFALIQLTKPAPHLTIGSHSVIGRHNVIAVKGRTSIGEYTLLGPYCQINDQSHGMSRDELIKNQKAIIKPVTIGSDCWLGAGTRVLPGVTIGDGAILGTGSVVTHDVPPYQVWAGVPARYIRDRT
jgi:acetyltransferase-like isoleucine patch superfamily enzyme